MTGFIVGCTVMERDTFVLGTIASINEDGIATVMVEITGEELTLPLEDLTTEIIRVSDTWAPREIKSPPSFDSLFAELADGQSDAEKAQTIMERNGLDGLEMGDDPDFQSADRTTVYHIISLLFSRGWSFSRISEWCAGAKRHCSFTLNGQIVR